MFGGHEDLTVELKYYCFTASFSTFCKLRNTCATAQVTVGNTAPRALLALIDQGLMCVCKYIISLLFHMYRGVCIDLVACFELFQKGRLCCCWFFNRFLKSQVISIVYDMFLTYYLIDSICVFQS